MVGVGRTMHEHARVCPDTCAQTTKLKWTGVGTMVPFGWTVSKQKPQCLWLRDKVPGIPGGDLNQPHGEEKGCEERPPLFQFLRKVGEATCSIASALEVLDPVPRDKNWNPGAFLPG